LYDAFLPEYYWTEVMECLRKLLLTGFVVFFYEGSGLQIFCSMIISIVFSMVYTKLNPYLMPSNNTFAIFVHFQVTFTLACTLLLRMNENLTDQERQSFHIDSTSLSYALLISNASVLLIGLILIGRACFNTSEGDFLDVGFDEHYDEYEDSNQQKKNDHEDHDDEEGVRKGFFLKDESNVTNDQKSKKNDHLPTLHSNQETSIEDEEKQQQDKEIMMNNPLMNQEPITTSSSRKKDEISNLHSQSDQKKTNEKKKKRKRQKKIQNDNLDI